MDFHEWLVDYALAPLSRMKIVYYGEIPMILHQQILVTSYSAMYKYIIMMRVQSEASPHMLMSSCMVHVGIIQRLVGRQLVGHQ